MTVAAQTPTISYNGNGTTTVFAAPFRYIAPTDLRVLLRTADGSESQLTYGTGFTASAGNTNAGGNVTLAVAPASGVTVVITRVTARTQPADYITTGPFQAESHEEALDRAIIIAQEQDAELLRAVKAPRGEVGLAMRPRATLEGKLLAVQGQELVPGPTIPDLEAAADEAISAISAAGEAILGAFSDQTAALLALAGSNAIEAVNYRAGLAASASGQPFFVMRDQQAKRWINAAGVSRDAPDFVFPASPTLPPLPELRPGATWNGTAGSGFASVPTDPARTSAKPAVRLIVPPFQRYTDTLLVGVIAFALNNGTLVNNMGIDRVQFDYEGRQIDVTTPTYRTFNDVNGNPVTYFGWWVNLKHPNPGAGGNARTANLYARAFAQDATMQSRLIGPFQFNPVQAIYDKEIEIAATPAEIPGQRYKTLANAMVWMRDNNTTYTNPRITFTEAGNYAFAPPSFGDPGAANGWITVRATAPIVFNAGDAGFGGGVFWARTNNWRIMGANITIDFEVFRSFYNSEADGREYWFDGCTLTVSGGRYSLKDRNEVGPGITGKPWLTECNFVNGVTGGQASLARGCTYTRAWRVIFNNARCVIGCRVVDADSTEYTATLNALSVTYTGTEATASIAISGGNNESGKVVTLKYGATTTTFAIDTAIPSGSAYKVSDVVAWINTKPGFTATTLDNTRRAASLTRAGAPSFGGFGDTSVKSTTLTLLTAFDIHSDLYMLLPGLPADNIIVWGNSGEDINDMQVFFAQPTGVGSRDVLIANNAFAVVDGFNLQSQLQGSLSHFVLIHNSVAEQLLTLSTNQGLTLDGYCLVANNAFEGMQWDGAPLSTTAIRDNHLNAGATAPATATGTSIGGTTANLFGNAAAGDFSPRGALLTNQKTARLPFDRVGDRRTVLAPAGAVA